MLPVFLLVAGVGAVVYSLDKMVNKKPETKVEKVTVKEPEPEPKTETIEALVKPKKKKSALEEMNAPDGNETTEKE
jgi:hypothetical protein